MQFYLWGLNFLVLCFSDHTCRKLLVLLEEKSQHQYQHWCCGRNTCNTPMSAPAPSPPKSLCTLEMPTSVSAKSKNFENHTAVLKYVLNDCKSISKKKFFWNFFDYFLKNFGKNWFLKKLFFTKNGQKNAIVDKR